MKQVKQKEEPSKQITREENREPLSQGLNPYVKGILYISGAVFTLWVQGLYSMLLRGLSVLLKILEKVFVKNNLS